MMNVAQKRSPEDKRPEAVTPMVMRLFEHWGLTYEQQAALLSLSTSTRSTIARYKRGVAYLSQDRDTRDRAGHLLAIHKYLRTIFPLNQELVYKWPTKPNTYFGGKTPVDFMIDEGFLGLVKVRRYLENYMAS